MAAFKGVFFNAGDLPADVRQRDALLLRVIGSPDPYRKHSDRLGGATSSTSKVVLLSKSQRAGCDVDYLFGAVAIDAPLIDWPGIGTSENRRHSADGRDRLANRKGDFIAQCARDHVGLGTSALIVLSAKKTDRSLGAPLYERI